jgi:transposase-like protein
MGTTHLSVVAVGKRRGANVRGLLQSARMAPYPPELRVRVVVAVEDGGLAMPEAARIFQVGLTVIQKMLKWHRAGESLEPRHGGGPVP